MFKLFFLQYIQVNLFINEFAAQIIYIPGKSNVIADFLSRHIINDDVVKEDSVMLMSQIPLTDSHIDSSSQDDTNKFESLEPLKTVTVPFSLSHLPKEPLNIDGHQNNDVTLKKIVDNLRASPDNEKYHV